VNVESQPVDSLLDPHQQIHEAFRQALAETLARVTAGQTLERLLTQLLRERVSVVVAANAPTVAEPPEPAIQHLLTVREQEVLTRIAAGDSNKQIARAFGLSLHTVKRHVANILSKLGVSSRAQAAAWMRARH
jgi:DNA-binding NarL/FixJ family response regulator